MSDVINILSYNICWGCMSSNETSSNDVTAKFLATECYNLKKTTGENICLKNVSQVISNKKYDIIGLQEATNWRDILEINSHLREMKYVHSLTEATILRTGVKIYADLVTFYNGNKFRLNAVKQGNLDNDHNDARPYHILFLTHLASNYKFLIINLHNGKGEKYNIPFISYTLGKEINMCVVPDSINQNLENIQEMGLTDISDIIGKNVFKTIVLGDFNDSIEQKPQQDYWEKLNPILSMQFRNLDKIIVRLPQKPPNTCCIGYGNIRGQKLPEGAPERWAIDRFIGDYILISRDLEYLGEPVKIVKYIDPGTDHLPVESNIYLKYILTSTNSNKYLKHNSISEIDINLDDVSLKKKYIMYKQKYLKLKNKIGGTIDTPGNTHDLSMNIRSQYNDDESNNINEDEYKILTIKNNLEYFNELYPNNNLLDNDLKFTLLDKFNLYYKKLYLKGVGINEYPYGIFQLKNYISFTNEYRDLIERNILFLNNTNLNLHTLTHNNKKFIEIIRFEKDVNDNFVFQDVKAEKVSDPGYVIKGTYYYPCLGSGIFLHCNNIKYYYNKLHAISEMHQELIEQSQLSLHVPKLKRSPSSLKPGYTKYELGNTDENLYTTIKKENIIKEFIKNNKFGRFDASKSVVLSNINYICDRVQRFDHLNTLGIISYLTELFCNKKNIVDCTDNLKDLIYDLYYKIFSGELTLNDLNIFTDTNPEISFSKYIKYLYSKALDNGINTNIKLQELFKDKTKISEFINRNDYLSFHMKSFKNNNIYLDSKPKINIELIISNIMIEMYSKIYNADFNQIIIDSTIYYYARKLNIDTIVIMLEPTDRPEIFGCEIISVEDYQSDSFNRTINYRKMNPDQIETFNDSLNTYFNTFREGRRKFTL